MPYNDVDDVDQYTDEEKKKDLNRSWALARTKLGIAAGTEETALKRKEKLWKDYIEDLLVQQSDAFKERNVASSLWGKALGFGANWLGQELFPESKWIPEVASIGGVTAGKYIGTTYADPSEIEADYDEFAEKYDISDTGDSRFFKGERAAFEEGVGLDLEDMKEAMDRAYSEEQTSNILTGLTDVYGIHKVSQDEDLAWLYNLFGSEDEEKES